MGSPRSIRSDFTPIWYGLLIVLLVVLIVTYRELEANYTADQVFQNEARVQLLIRKGKWPISTLRLPDSDLYRPVSLTLQNGISAYDFKNRVQALGNVSLVASKMCGSDAENSSSFYVGEGPTCGTYDYESKLLSLSNVCVNGSNIIFLTNGNATAAREWEHTIAQCCAMKNAKCVSDECKKLTAAWYSLCNDGSKVVQVQTNSASAIVGSWPYVTGSTWWHSRVVTSAHQPADSFAVQMLQFLSSVVGSLGKGTIPVETLYMQTHPSQYTEWEEFVYNVARAGFESRTPTMQFPIEISEDVGMHKPVCFETVHVLPNVASAERFLPSPSRFDPDYVNWRSALAAAGVHSSLETCPPRKVFVLHSADDGKPSIVDLTIFKNILTELNISYPVEVISLTSAMSAKLQATAFSAFGLLFATHSPFLSNLIFASKNAAVIELSQFEWISSFENLGRMMGAWYSLSSGHTGTGAEIPDDVVQACTNTEMLWKKGVRRKCAASLLKSEPLAIDAAALKKVVSNAVAHLNDVCDGKW